HTHSYISINTLNIIINNINLIFFFQAEDGIRDFHVTGVQTCALPISGEALLTEAEKREADLIVMGAYGHSRLRQFIVGGVTRRRSEERRVGKECRSRRAPKH